MYIQNVRLGFATNSSSSHSVLLIPDHLKSSVQDDYDGDPEFGWQEFTLASSQSKFDYFVAIASSSLSKQGYSPKQIQSIVENIAGDEYNFEKASHGNIDHQSMPLIPEVKGGNFDLFLKELYDYLMQDNHVIIGGNDNDDLKNPLLDKEGVDEVDAYSSLPFDARGPLVARKVGQYWILFNQNNGGKMRLSFEDSPAPLTKLDVPELVDIKITDFCPFGCDFCYQNSTHRGVHANTGFIEELARALGENQVFEVALGGGETTMHPDFIHILKTFKDNGVMPNFTTKNPAWIRQNGSEIMNIVGAVAFSVETVEDIDLIMGYIHKYIYKGQEYNQSGLFHNNKIQFQFVMGSQPIDEFEKILHKISEHHVGLTLLGYKHAGRGHVFEPYDYSQWLDLVSDNMASYKIKKLIKIDTALAAQYKNEMLAKDIPESSFHTTEGNFSLYIDAVSQTMAPSSYIGMEQTIPMNLNTWVKDYESIGIDVLDVIKQSYETGYNGKIIDESTKPKFRIK